MFFCNDFFAFTSFGWCYQCPVFAIGCEYTVKTDEVYSGPGNQSVQPGDGRSSATAPASPRAPTLGAIAPGCFQLIADLAITCQ